MNRIEKMARLKAMVKQIAPEADLKALATESLSGLESVPGAADADAAAEAAQAAVDKVMTGTGGDLSDAEAGALEAIVLRQGRPVAFIRGGKYDPLDGPWAHLNDTAVRQRLQPAFPSIGRVDLPNSSIPYGGTAFVVGPNLLMTNRHVAGLFTVGLGSRGLRFQAGDAAVNFKREVGSPPDDRSAVVEVREVVMVHPFWDMALLRVTGLPAAHRPLRLAAARPEDLLDRDVVVVGYPALDPRNDLDLQNQIFGRRYEVKRMHPGKLRRRESIRSFESTVNAATHDSSTLGGNSGSAVLDVRTGEVVALHFAGVYLKANYAVPTYELARDPRVVDAGVNFTDRLPPSGEWDQVWSGLEGTRAPAPAPTPQPNGQTPPPSPDGTMTWTIPLRVSVSFGPPVPDHVPAAPPAPGPVTEARMQVPVIGPDLESREGYSPDFLGEEPVPLPKLTPTGSRVAAKLEDGTTELKYHHFSVVMNKKRRLSVFTAANVDWRPAVRLVNGRKPSRRELTGLADNAQEEWVTDPRIPDGHQLPDVFFTKDGAAFDKGHLVRRDDVVWGTSFADMQLANGDTYHTTNCSPQVAGFNRSANGEDNWGDLENLVQRETKAERVCVFAGPVMAEDDPVFAGRDKRGPVRVQIPRQFWKVVVANAEDGPRAYGFVLEQDLSAVPVEFAVPQAWERYMKPVAEIEEMLNGWVKLTWLKEHDGFETGEGRRMATAARRRG
jgi:endonuclease G